ncbi:MAG: hypothetical protein IT303_13285 [Dehalococcoidia bacterium]|nr:hypothetical protein [Dehalococcoidia bacterium]
MSAAAWCAWVGMVMVVALATSNPFYLAVILLGVLLVAAVAPRTTQGFAGFRALLLFGVGMLGVSVVVATINGNYGDHILFEVPGPALPWWMGGLRLGGPVSAEGLVAATIRGFAILSVFLAFGVFNAVVSPHRVLRGAPAALFHAGLVVTVGLTLLPSSIEDVRRIRELRALRGAPAGWRQLPALVVPAVIGGLERSMRLAEAMEARGYASAPPPARGPRLVGATAAPLFLAAASTWAYWERFDWLAVVLAALGAAALGWWAWSAARAHHTTRLHDEPLPLADRVAIAASLGLAVFAIAGKEAGILDTGYNPFAGLPMPGFEPLGAALALATAWPALRIAFAPAPRPASDRAPETRAVRP